jgi:uncharacterized protein (TIGR00369 family)
MEMQNRIHKMLEKQHFMNLIGFKITQINEGEVEGELDLEEKHMQHFGLLHGGVTATLSDIVAGFAAYTLVEINEKVVTVDLRISYLNPGIGSKLKAKGSVLKRGAKLIFCESEIFIFNNNNWTLIAKSSSTMARI